MSTITETKRRTEAICPSWCDGHDDGGYQSWEARTSDGGQQRGHAHSWPSIDTSAAWFTGGASLDVNRTEEENGKLRDATVTVYVGSDAATLTPAEARLYAARLIEAADLAERETGKGA